MLTNNTNIPLSLAVWLAFDTYVHSSDPKTISATGLLKPLRSIILERKIPISTDADISDVIQSRLGTSVHTSIERAWTNNYKIAMKSLGYPDTVIQDIVLNPPSYKTLQPTQIPVYMEKRSYRKLHDWTISGQFDFVVNGALEDFKTTGTYNYIKQGNTEKYKLQGSIYRWLNPEIITNDHMSIAYLFTDWSAIKAKSEKDYPGSRIMSQKILLLSFSETENFISNKLSQIELGLITPQEHLPRCTKEELWQQDAVWKYYKNPDKRTRSTKNFDNSAAAYAYMATNGNVGIIIEVPGEVKFCNYCNAKSICTQAEDLKLAGLLK